MKNSHTHLHLLVLAIAASNPVALAVTDNALSEDTRPVHKVELKTDPALNDGRVGMVGGCGRHCRSPVHAAEFDIDEPVAVAVLARDSTHPLKVEVFKSDWKTAHRSGSTDAAGTFSTVFRTQGSIKVQVLPVKDEPAPYDLVIFAAQAPEALDVARTFKPLGAASSAGRAPATAAARTAVSIAVGP